MQEWDENNETYLFDQIKTSVNVRIRRRRRSGCDERDQGLGEGEDIQRLMDTGLTVEGGKKRRASSRRRKTRRMMMHLGQIGAFGTLLRANVYGL